MKCLICDDTIKVTVNMTVMVDANQNEHLLKAQAYTPHCPTCATSYNTNDCNCVAYPGRNSFDGNTLILFAEDEIDLIRDNVRVSFFNMEEGYDGDYDPDDPDDENFLRFDIFALERGEWEEVPNGSFCTLFPASAPVRKKIAALEKIIEEVYEPIKENSSIKRIAGRLSWIEPNSFEPFPLNKFDR